MSLTVEPARFKGLPLIIKATAENDFTVMCDGLRVGRLFLRHVANGASHWFWTISGPATVQANLSSSGHAESLEAAKTAFRERFDAWLSWALEADVAVHWHARELWKAILVVIHRSILCYRFPLLPKIDPVQDQGRKWSRKGEDQVAGLSETGKSSTFNHN